MSFSSGLCVGMASGDCLPCSCLRFSFTTLFIAPAAELVPSECTLSAARFRSRLSSSFRLFQLCLPQVVFWVPFTIVVGGLFGAIGGLAGMGWAAVAEAKAEGD